MKHSTPTAADLRAEFLASLKLLTNEEVAGVLSALEKALALACQEQAAKTARS